MTPDEIDFLTTPEARELIERHISGDPARVALSLRHPHAALIASQVKYLQRARTKLPSYYAARCIIPPLAFEQSSSEATAAHKAYTGRLCIDLTCGLGVDALAFSHRFARVVAIERDPALAAIARHNFARLGAPNIEVICMPAEEFIAKWAKAGSPVNTACDTPTGQSHTATKTPSTGGTDETDEIISVTGSESCPSKARTGATRGLAESPDRATHATTGSQTDMSVNRSIGTGHVGNERDAGAGYPPAPADLIYADPARRGADNARLVLLEECSPDVLALLPTLRNLAHAVVVKASPLFDVDEAFRLFGPRTRVEVVSLHGECKEVLIETGPHLAEPRIRVSLPGIGEAEFARDGRRTSTDTGSTTARTTGNAYSSHTVDVPEPNPARYLIVPDVALYKARVVDRYFGPEVRLTSTTGYCFANHVPAGLLGKAYPIAEVHPFRPKVLKKLFRERGIDRLTILKKDFPLTAAAIAASLGIREGGTQRAAFTQIGGERLIFLLEDEETA